MSPVRKLRRGAALTGRLMAAALGGLGLVLGGAVLAGPAVAAVPDDGAASAGTVSAADASGVRPAGVDDFEFTSLDVEFDVSRDEDGVGVATVTETFVADFPPEQNRGIQRQIPLESFGAPSYPSIESVTDESGAERDYDTESEDGYFSITSAVPEGEYVEGSQTYVITYTLENVGHAMENGLDEFYWDINGEQWAQPFGSVSATVVVDPDLAPALTGDSRCYIGATEECGIWDSEDSDGSVTFETGSVSADPYESATVAIGFEPGTFTPFDASPFASVWGWVTIAGALGAAAMLVWGIITRRRHLRDAPGRSTIIAEYGPPEGVDAIRASKLLSKGASSAI
ncbi:MAG: DUF2207 domain-containing protein, partial [Microbacterium sp.]